MKPQSAMAPMTLAIEGTTVKRRGCKGPLYSYIHMKDGTVVSEPPRFIIREISEARRVHYAVGLYEAPHWTAGNLAFAMNEIECGLEC